jgi:hypothetical protein
MADLMKNAAVTHQELSRTLSDARGLQRDKMEEMVQDYAAAMIELERVMGQIINRPETPVAESLRQKPQSPEKVMLAVNDLVGTAGEGGTAGKLAGEGIHPPVVLSEGPTLPKPLPANPLQPRKPTSVPASSPAQPGAALPGG